MWGRDCTSGRERGVERVRASRLAISLGRGCRVEHTSGARGWLGFTRRGFG